VTDSIYLSWGSPANAGALVEAHLLLVVGRQPLFQSPDWFHGQHRATQAYVKHSEFMGIWNNEGQMSSLELVEWLP